MEMKSETCGNGEIILFGVRVVVDSMRKSVSMNNLSQYEQPHHQPQAHQDGEASNNSSNKIQSKDDVAAGYASADDAIPSSRATRERERKRGPTLIDHRSLYFGKAIRFPSPTSATSPRTSGSPIVTNTLSSNGSEKIQQVEQNRKSEAAESSRKAKGKAKVSLNDGKRKTKLPLNSLAILHDAGVRIDTSSLDELCQRLYDGVFLKPGILKYFVDRKFNKNCFVLFARGLDITWYEYSQYWQWNQEKDRESGEDIEVAKLVNVSWLYVGGSIWTVDLSPRTLYEIIFDVKIINCNLTGFSMKLTITFPNSESTTRYESLNGKPLNEWIQIQVGEFKMLPEFVGHLKFSLEETNQKWKSGLLVKCAVVRPKMY